MTANLSSEENNLCVIIATNLVETKGTKTPLLWQYVLHKDLQRAEELFPIIQSLTTLMADLVEKNIDIEEYSIMINNIFKENHK